MECELKHLISAEMTRMAEIEPKWLKFEAKRNGVIECTRYYTGTENSGHFDRNGTEFKTLIFAPIIHIPQLMKTSSKIFKNIDTPLSHRELVASSFLSACA